MTIKLFFATIFSFTLTMQTAHAFFEKQTIEAQAAEVSASDARQSAQEARDNLIAKAEEDCLASGSVFEILNKWTSHRKSGFKFVATAGAVVSCL